MAENVKKILLADDDTDDREIIEDGFASLGMADIAHYTKDGEEVLKYLETSFQSGSLPLLIILDLNMPRMNGSQTLTLIKKDKRFCRIPVYIYSTSLNPIEKDLCMLIGAEGYMIKPISHEESLATARHFLAFVK
jgi:CheY-like chemotaxis protein